MILGFQPLAQDQQIVINKIFLPNLAVDSLINTTSRTWNLHAIQSLVDPQDIQIVQSMHLSRIQMSERNGWHFTNNEKYTVKSGY